ncbi:zinc-binding dehydrogenase [Streptomyces achromogenes]|uniref:zinc-dependent alcohol dehydrogenase n=1 Tax=Streptomyces achromogenes TaxID=67255 RepID=UPI0036FA0A0B
MRALVYLGSGALELREHPVPALPGRDDVRVRVTGTGICGTDRKILLGHFPAREGVVLGHESVGVVESTGPDVTSVRPGDRVVVNPTLYCGRCRPCRRGATNFCRNKRGTEVGVDRDGTYADYTVLPERFVERLPDGVPFHRAVLIEPLACVLNNVLAADVTYADTVTVLGAGPIGVLTGLVAARRARRVVVVETDPYRLTAARDTFERVVDAGGPDPVKAIVTAGDGHRPDVVLDTTGSAVEQALRLVADGGRVVAMGFDDTYSVPVRPLYLTNHGISLLGAGDYRADVFPVAVELIGELPVDGLVTHQLPLERHEEAFGLLSSGSYGALKVVIRSDPAPVDADGWPEGAR